MKYSLIVPFRDREKKRIERCLQSLENQYFTDFEIIFFDYGSQPNYQIEVENICKKFSKVRYQYAETRGWLWCKAQAINASANLATGKYVIMIDVDLIYCHNFLEIIDQKVQNHTEVLLHYRCYLLPENFTDYENLFKISTKNFKSTGDQATGLFVANREKLIEIGGSDEFYLIWGMEDSDLSERIAKSGAKVHWFSAEEISVFHQWHPHAVSHPLIPKNWVFVVNDYKYSQTEIYRKSWYKQLIPQITDRPALQIALKKEFSGLKKIQICQPLERFFNEFFAKIQIPDQGLYLEYSRFDFEQNTSFFAKMIFFVNKLAQKIGTGYRISNQEFNLTYHILRDFVYFFILYHRKSVKDYHFEVKNDSFRLILIT